MYCLLSCAGKLSTVPLAIISREEYVYLYGSAQLDMPEHILLYERRQRKRKVGFLYLSQSVR